MRLQDFGNPQNKTIDSGPLRKCDVLEGSTFTAISTRN